VDGLPPGRAFRQHIPLLTGEDVINFFPNGDAGLPVSGTALLAIQAFPLGCAKCAGRLLAVHSDNDRITLHFARAFLTDNRRRILLAQEQGSEKLPDAGRSQRTLLVETLLQAADMQHDEQSENRPFSVTAYHLSNSGQGPGLTIYHLPLQVIGFLRDMDLPEHRATWNAVARRAWDLPPKPKRGAEPGPQEFAPRRNWLYEDLFALPGNAARFLRTYFLRVALHAARADSGDPRSHYSTRAEIELVSWSLTTRFLRRILHMERDRVEKIRNLADRLADYVNQENDKRFFQNFYLADRADHLRTLLVKANLAHVKRGHPPIIEFEPYIEVFEEGVELARPDWRLARDLVLIRMIEQLYAQGWLGAHRDALPETEPVSEDIVNPQTA
jgi:CRISPR-associated protein Cst1